jgi:transcriptional regulator GlxA family with amidase domain
MRSARQAGHTPDVSIDQEARLAFVDACQIFVGRQDAKTDESVSAVCEMLTRVLQRVASGSAGAPARQTLARPPANRPTTNFRVPRVLSYLEGAFADPTIRLASAARHVDVTPSHLDRLLKEHTGQTFLQQLRRIRMRHAEHLLLTTTLSIKETAYASGYTSAGSFDRDFGRAHGCAPRVWRAIQAVVAEPSAD